MKIVARLLAMTCLTLACVAAVAFSGCSNDPATPGTADEAAPQTEVLRYGPKDIAALPLGQALIFDLTRADKVYVLTYSDPADLDHVLVVRDDEKYILGERAKAGDAELGAGPKEIVVSADGAQGQAEGSDTVCNCPCCQLVNGVQVCC